MIDDFYDWSIRNRQYKESKSYIAMINIMIALDSEDLECNPHAKEIRDLYEKFYVEALDDLKQLKSNIDNHVHVSKYVWSANEGKLND